MKVAFISTLDEALWGGSEELWSQAAIEFKQKGNGVMASVAHWRLQSDKLKELIRKGVSVHSHWPRRPSRARRMLNVLSRDTFRNRDRIKDFSPDLVVISQGYNAGGFEWAKKCREARIPYVIVVHCNSDLWWFHDQVIADALSSYVGAQIVFCVSKSNLDLLRLQVGDPLPNAEVIWSPYNVSTEQPPEWPCESDGYRIACVARLDPAAKGQDLLMRILALPKWRERRVQLVFFGSGSNEIGLRRLAEMLRLNNISFHEYVENVRSIWKKNHILVLPSRYEGLPLVLIESMWCGRPAVVTDVGGNAELCIDGSTGFIAQAATFRAFDETFERAWSCREKWRDMGRAARVRAEEIIPTNPVLLFCERLEACIRDTRGEKVNSQTCNIDAE